MLEETDENLFVRNFFYSDSLFALVMTVQNPSLSKSC